MPQYNIGNKRQPDGTRLLSYGKGKKKLTAVMGHDEDFPQHWIILSGDYGVHQPWGGLDDFHFGTMKGCKAAWGEWAADNYGLAVTRDASSVSADAAPPPPVFAPPYEPQGTEPDEPDELEVKPLDPSAADPFDPRFRASSAGKPDLPLGVVLQVRQWFTHNAANLECLANTTRAVNKEIFHEVRELLDACLRRECPDLFPPLETIEDAQPGPTRPPAFASPAPVLTLDNGAVIPEDDVPF